MLFSMVCGRAPSSCSTTLVPPALSRTVTVTWKPDLRHCSRAALAASCAALSEIVRCVIKACAEVAHGIAAIAAAMAIEFLIFMIPPVAYADRLRMNCRCAKEPTVFSASAIRSSEVSRGTSSATVLFRPQGRRSPGGGRTG